MGANKLRVECYWAAFRLPYGLHLHLQAPFLHPQMRMISWCPFNHKIGQNLKEHRVSNFLQPQIIIIKLAPKRLKLHQYYTIRKLIEI